MSAIKKLASQTAIYGLSSMIGRFLNYLLVPLYTRVFERAEYGVISEFYAYISFLLILFTYGMETAFFHFSQKEDKEKVYSNTLFMLLCSSVIICVIFFFSAAPLANAIGYSKKANYIIWITLIIAFDTLAAIPFARLRQQNKAVLFTCYRLLNILLNIFLNFFFLYVCPKYVNGDGGLLTQIANSVYSKQIGIGYVFISNLLSSFITFLIMLPQYRNITLKPDFGLLKRMLLYASPLLIAGFAGMINETLDRAVYKYLAPNPKTALAELGVYSACYKLSIIITIFIQTFRFAAEPFFFAQAKKDEKREIFARVMKYFVIICAFIFVAVMLYIDLIKLFIGEEYRTGLGIVPILMMANICLGIFYNLSMWYKVTGQTKYGAYFAMFGAIITIVLLIVLIPKFGYMGAAWATLVTYAAMMVLSYTTGQKNYPVPYNIGEIFTYLSVALMVYLAGLGINKLLAPEGIVHWLLQTALLAAFVLIIYLIERPKHQTEKIS
ncbi:MAG TPA: polysaccharide biosynthesis C-terminal domain-containing protein [Bacteroidia bacterium]|nr:polysaccharide biosynthesis C-terminal domain-containing protein [Bacteroidia bacterium]HNU32078.1 polysaccharide biosynthesis C-terminal domain-containing protein [Bacteroidia bacterium]